MSQTSSEDRERTLDSMRNKQDGCDKHSHSMNNIFRASIILAGHLATQQSISLSDSCNTVEKNCNTTCCNRLLLKDTLSTSDETLYHSYKPDLNKCINLFHNEHTSKEYSLEEQSNTTLSKTIASRNINPCHLNKNKIVLQQDLTNLSRSASADSLIHIVLFNRGLGRSKSYTTLDRALNRDTNYNIKANQFSFPDKIAIKISRNKSNGKIETIVPSFDELSLSKSFTSSSGKVDSHSTEDQRYDSVNSEESSKEELNPTELKTFLYLLADQEPLKETVTRQLRRMSANYYDSPKNFTERLLTIVEESVVNNDLCAQYSNISLFRFNEELRKTCKFIEDETVPVWPQSPGMSASIGAKRKSLSSGLSRRSLAFATPNKDLYTMPVSSQRNIKSPKRIHWRKSKNISYTARNLLHDSTCTFENLEAYCEGLFPNEYKAREKIELQSPLQNMDNILRTCENQMASLEDSLDIREQIEKAGACISDSADQHIITPETQILQYRLLPCKKYDRTDSKRVSDGLKHQTECGKCQEVIELDTLENSLMYEIAKKRQRCLDTAKVLMEIDASSASAEVKKPCPGIAINEISPTRNDDEFMQTLKCVKKYRNYLEKRKSLLSLLHQARSSSPRTPYEKDIRAKMSNENAGTGNVRLSTCTLSTLLGNKPTLGIPKLSPRRKSTSSSPTKHCPTSKTLVSKPRLFVTPGKKSPVNFGSKVKRTYFPNMLPGMNKQSETKSGPGARIFREIGNYEHVISPVGLYIKGVDSHLTKKPKPKMDGKLLTPRKQTIRSSSPKVKLRVSPKRAEEVNDIKFINVISKICNALGILLYYFKS